MWALNPILLVATLVVKQVWCLPKNHTDDQVNADIDFGTFQNPSPNARPRFRNWIPDASVNLTRLTQDIEDVKSAGLGGVEVLGYYLYDSAPGDFAPSDWAIYGWGTPAWKDVFDTLVKAHKDNGLIMDFAMGPNQGQGVPANPDDDGLLWDLFAFNTTVPIGGSFNGTIPGWGTVGTLQALVTGLATKSEITDASAPSLPNTVPANRTQITLAADTLTDVTHLVNDDGTVNLTFSSQETGLFYQVFAFYLVREHYRNEAYPPSLRGPQTIPQDFVHNGSWTVDHFSARGAKVMTDFWEKYLLINGSKEALMEVGNYGWEDSCEINPLVYWTKDLPERFQAERGYNISQWLPLIFHQDGRASFGGATWWITDEFDSGNQHIADYRTTLTEMYGDYLKALTEWANEFLDVQFSAQVSYNMAMDMQSNIPNVNGPECESLGFGHVIDAYRQYAGPANLAGKRIISTECGANPLEVFQQTLPELMWDVKRSIAGSVNNFVFHGLPYSGDYGNTTWPVFTTFPYVFSEMHGRHQPAFEFYSDSMDFTARLQFIFQSGVPKFDIAFYQKFTVYPDVPRNYQPVDLETNGFAYEYINDENMYLPAAVVENETLAPTRQSFQALVLRANDSMTVKGVQKIVEYAQDGLPIVFSGGLPNYLASYNSSGTAYMNSALESISKLDNVHVVPDGEISPVLSDLGIKPLTSVVANRIWYTYWRFDEKENQDYVFVYNDAAGIPRGSGGSEGTVEFRSTGSPYFYDAWSGQQTPILNYTQSNATTTIFFSLAGNQSIIVAFHNDEEPLAQHVEQTSSGILGLSSNGSTITAQVGAGDSNPSVTTADGQTHSLPSNSNGPIVLGNWTLIVEHWDPPDDLFDIDTIANKHNTTHQLPSLVSWQEISGLTNVSGRGYYSTTFNWTTDEQDGTMGAIIDFGPIVHSIRVSINGNTLPSLDTTAARADISKFLVAGENKVEAVVATTLVNVLTPIWFQLESSAIFATNGPLGLQDYGLLFDVVVTPYLNVDI